MNVIRKQFCHENQSQQQCIYLSKAYLQNMADNKLKKFNKNGRF